MERVASLTRCCAAWLVFLLLAGCGSGFSRGMLNSSIGGSTRWSVPSGIPAQASNWGGEISWTFGDMPFLRAVNVGAWLLSSGSGHNLLLGSVSGAPLEWLSLLNTGDRPVILPVLVPALGFWIWPDSPEEAGFLIGLKTGVLSQIYSVNPRTECPDWTGYSVVLEYGWWWLGGAAGDKTARVETISLRLIRNFW